MTGRKNGPAAALTANGDAKHVQPASEQTIDSPNPGATKRPRDPFQQNWSRWFRGVIAHPGLRKGASDVLFFVSDHASVREKGFSWFGHSTIAAGTAMSVTAVQRAIRSAEQCGLLLVVSHKDQRKPAHYWPLLGGRPLSGELPEALKHRAKVTDAETATSGRSDRCGPAITSVTSASDIGQNSRQHRAKVTDNLLKDLPNDPPNYNRPPRSLTISYGARATGDDEDQDEEIKQLRDDPLTRRKAERVFIELGVRPDTNSDVRSVARGIARLERVARMDFEREVMPAIAAIANRRACPRFVNCKWMEQHVAAEVMLMRDEAGDARR